MQVAAIIVFIVIVEVFVREEGISVSGTIGLYNVSGRVCTQDGGDDGATREWSRSGT